MHTVVATAHDDAFARFQLNCGDPGGLVWPELGVELANAGRNRCAGYLSLGDKAAENLRWLLVAQTLDSEP